MKLSKFRLLIVLLATFPFFQKGIGQVVQTFNSSGNFTVPAGVTSIKVEVWGAGASGSRGVGGGGGGAFAGNNSLTVVSGNTYTVTAGTGAAAGSGLAGGNSSFSNLVIAEGGGNGANITIGGRVANSTGSAGLVWAGGNGGTGSGNGGGGGGGSAGAGGAGGNGGNTNNNTAGIGGIAGIAGTGTTGAAGGIGGTNNGSGATGVVPGGGGGEKGNTGASSGGGGNGRVIITYYLPPSISNISPASTCTGSGATITITGTNFTNPSTVKFFNNITATSTFVNSTTLTAVVPAGATTGSISVTTPGGNATSATFTISALPTADAGSGLIAICQGGISAPLGGSVGGSATGGIWSTPTGGTFNPGATTLNATWTPPPGFSGTATLTLTTTGGGCSPVPASKSQVVNALPAAAISYTGSPFCNSLATPQPVSQTGTSGGTYTAPGGLSINSSTGDITPSSSTPGTYIVTYSFTNGTCANTATTNVTITALPVATFSYTGSPYCSNTANPLPTLGSGATAGTFSSTAGLNFVNASTGLINLGTSTANTYTVTNTIAAANGCAVVTATSNVTILAAPSAGISYAGTPFCTSLTTPQAVTQTGTSGGTYTATGGLTINSSTGDITPSTSTPGTYAVTYSFTNGTCANTATTSITITAQSVPTFGYTGSPYCSNAANPLPTFSGGGIAGVFSSTSGLNFISTASGQVNVLTSTPATYTVTNTIAASAGCALVSATAAITINSVTNPTFTTSPGASVCASTNITYTTQPGQSTYVWSVPGVSGTDYTITSGGTGSTDNTVTLQWLTTGSKTVTVNYTNAAGCTSLSVASNTTTVNARPTPTFTASAGASTCAITNVAYTTQPGQSSYVWTVPGVLGTDYTIIAGSLGSGSSTVTLQWLTAGNKTVTVNYNNGSGCTGLGAASNTTTVNLRPVAGAITGSNVVCVGSTISLNSNATGTPALTYGWSSSNTGLATVNASGVVTGIAAGSPNITYTVTDGNGCTATSASFAVTVNARPIPTFTSSAGANTCASTNVTYTTQASQSNYAWTVPGLLGTDYTIIAGGISSTDNTVTLQWLTTGSKTVTVNYTNGNSCTGASAASNSTTVNVRPVPSFTVSPSSPLCTSTPATYTTQGGQSSYVWNVPGVSGTDYTITAGGTGGTNSTVTLQWLTSGSKTVTVNYSNTSACTGIAAASSTITVTARPVAGFTTSPGASVCASTNITYTTQPGQSTYVWSVPGVSGTDYTITSGGTGSTDNTVTLQWLTTGSKTVTVNYTNAAGCTSLSVASNTTTVNARPTPTFTASAGASTCAITNVAYTTQPGQSSYVWTVPGVLGTDYTIIAGSLGSGSSTVTLQWLTAGNKTVTVNYNNGSGCTGLGAASNTTTVNLRPVAGAITGSNVVCVGSTISLNSNATGTPALTYGWSSSNTGLATVNASGVVTGIAAGSPNITYTVTDGNGCTATSASFAVTVNARPIPTFTSSAGANTCASTNVTYTTQASQSNYAWTVPGLLGTDYTIIAGGISSTDNTVTLQWLTTGSKTVTVNYTNGNSCTGASAASNSTTVNVRPVPSFTVSPSSPLCTSTPATYTTQGGQSSYVWNVPGVSGTDYTITAGGTGGTNSTVTLQWLTSGSKTVTVNYSNTSACTGIAAASSTITVTARPVAGFTTSPGAAVCASTNVTYTTQASQSNYIWSVSGVLGTNYTIISGGTSSTDNTVTLQWLTAGSKTVTVNYTNSNGCTGASAASNTTTVNARSTPTFTATPGASTCATISVTYTTQSGQSSYVWSVPGVAGTDYTIISGGIGSTNNTVTLQWLTAGSKTVTVNYNNASGCTALTAASNTTTVNALPVVSTPTSSVCVGSTITLSPTAGGTWTSSNNAIATVTNAGVVTGVAAGSATFTFTQTSTGCINTTSSVTVNALPVVAPISSGAASICVNDITVFTNTTSGGTWSIINGTGTASIDAGGLVTGLSAGNVTVVYTYSNGTCTNTVTKSLTINTIPAVTPIGGGASAVCVNAFTPAFTNATPAGTWTIVNGSGSASITTGGIVTGISAGTVTVVYTVSNGTCSNEDAVSLTINPLPAVAPISGGVLAVCVNSITPAFTNTTPGGIWTITNGTGTASIDAGGAVTGLTAGNVTIVYTINNGTCSNVATKPLTVNPLPSLAAIAGGAPSVCVNSATPAFTNATSGGTWSRINGTGSANIDAGGIVTGLTPGTVTIVYTYSNGTCSNSVTTTITVNTLPLAAVITGPSAVCKGSTISLTSNASGTGSLTYTWASSNVSLATVSNAGVVTGVAAGIPNITYTLTDGNSCSATSPVFAVTVNAGPSANITSGNTVICNGGNTNITGTVAASGAWILTLSNGSTAAGTGNGTFNINVSPVVSTTYTVSSVVDATCTSVAGGLSGSTIVTVNEPVTITTQPLVTQTTCSGNSVSFSVVATGTGLTYQWRNGATPLTNGGNISGATSSTLVLNPAATSDASANYNVVVSGTNPCSPAISNNAQLVVNTAISISAQPVATQTLCSGSTATFTITATGTGLTYQWKKGGSSLSDGGNIIGSATNTLTISNITATDAATYTVAISAVNPCLPVTSANSILVVNTAVSIATQPLATQTYCSGTSASLTVAAAGTGLSYQWRKGSTPLVNGGNISGATSAILVLNPVATGDAAANYNVIISGANPCNPVVSNNASLFINQAVLITTQPITQTLCSGNTVTFTVVATGSGLTYQWRKNGTPLTNGGNISGSSTNTLTITGISTADAADYTVIVSGINPCAPVSSNTAILTVNAAVSIDAGPSDAAVCATLPADFTVTASGSGLTYQWYKSGAPDTLLIDNANISGTTTANLHFNQVSEIDDDDYYVVVSGLSPCPSQQSDYAHLSISRNITINTEPASINVCIGSDATFSVTAYANGDPLLYQWRKNGVNISGANLPSYIITGTTLADAGNYDVVITGINGCTIAYSSIALLTINPLSVGGTAGSSLSVCSNINSGTLNLTGQTGNVTGWQFSTDGGATWLPIANTTTSLNYANVTVVTLYRAIVQSGACAAHTSAPATISIKPIPDATATPASQTICSGATITTINLSGTLTGTTYNWTRNNTINVTGIPASGSGDISGGLTNITSSPVTVTLTVTPTANGCSGTPVTATVLVNPSPVATATPSAQSICSGSSITEIEFNSSVSGTTFTWTRDNVATVTGIAASGSDDDIDGSLTNTTLAPITVTFTIIPSANGCPGAPVTATVIVNPSPDATATPASQIICSGNIITTIVLSSNTTGATYTWTRNNTATVTGITASGTGDINGSLTNTSLSPVTVTFNITPFANGCAGSPITATVSVNPTPNVIATPLNQTICSAATITTIALTSGTAATTYTWTRNNAATVAGIAASGTGDISGSLTNTTTAPVTVTFTITPSANSCPGTPITATVLVNPTPNAIASTPAQTICSASGVTAISFSGSVATTTYNWTRDNTGTVTGIAANGTGTISGSLTNTTLLPITVTFTTTPIANGCPGTPITATVLVNPSPNAIATPASQTICSANGITTIALTSGTATTTYSWTRNNTATVTGIAASGTGNISGTLSNTTFAPITVTFTITPTANTCTGTPITATVLVNPTPNAVATPASQTVCSGSPFTTMALTGNVTSTTFNWTRNNTGTVTGIAASGSGDISGTLINTTNALITVTFTITPTANGCAGLPITATIAVKPTPTVSATPLTQTLCSGFAITGIAISNPNNVSGTTYTWTRDNTANLTGIASSGTGSSITGTLTNTTNVQQATTFTIMATAGGCSSTTTVVITVNPKPVITSASTANVCYNSAVNIPLTSTVASNYTWIAATNANVTGESTTTQTTSTLNNTLVNTSAVSQFTPKQNVIYTVIPTSVAGGCVGNSQTVTVTAYPRYNVSFYESSDDNGFSICDGDLVGGGGQNDIDLIEGQYAGSTLLWQYSIGTNAGPWSPVPGPHFNNLIHDTLPDPPSIFSPIGNYYFRLTVDGCPSDTLTLAKISTLTISGGGPNNTVCEVAAPTAITLSGASVSGTATTTVGGTWSISSLSPANGGNIGTLSSTAFITSASGNIPNVTYTPPFNYSGVVTLTLTSNDPDGTGPCVPLTATRTITVTQAPIISNALALSICSGTNTSISLSSVIPSTYSWTIGTITGGITGASPGSGANINQVLNNPGASAGTVQYNVTPTPVNPATCAAVTSTITVTVNPLPSINFPSNTPAAPICLGATSTLTAGNSGGTLAGNVAGNNYTAQTIQSIGTSTISSIITLPAGTITAASAITLSMNLNHTYAGDLIATLISPCGTATIFSRPGGTGNSNDLAGTYTFTTASATAFPANTNPVTAQTYNETYAGMTFPCNASGNWTLQISDNANGDGGSLNNWTLSINTNGSYTSVFSGPASIGSVTYSGTGNISASAIVTPPVGVNTYTVTTTDAFGCSKTSSSFDVTVNPKPTLTGASQQATVCAGSSAQINLTGLLASTTSTITYTVNGGSTQTVTGVVATVGGTASFNTIALTGANNGQTLQVTGVTITSAAPGCLQTFTQNVTLSVNQTPTLTGAAQPATVCPGSSAQINLTGLLANTTSTITYTINAGPVQTVTGVVASAGGAASFNTIALTVANNGQTLQVTGVTVTSSTPNCSQSFTRNVTLSVNPTPVLSSTLTPSDICSAATFSYTATSATGGATFGWTRAAIAGISQASSSGTGNINETLTNTTSAAINVIYVYTTTANGCNNSPGQNVVVRVNPSPTVATASLPATICTGSTATVSLTGLVPGSTSTIFYTINNVSQTPATGVVADGAGAGSFISTVVTTANNGQILKITGVSTTSTTPSCAKTVSVIAGVLTVNPQPTLSTVSQAASVCGTGGATITLTGMIANSTNNTINYTINGVAQPAVTGVDANAGGIAMFVTTPLTIANNGQPLTVTGITNGTCNQPFSKFTILVVNPSYVWLGINTDWFDVQNWCGGIPNNTTDVLIPGSLTFYPIITTGIPQVKDMNIQPTASVKLTGTKMQIAGAINNGGTFDATGGTIELNGTAGVQNISGSEFLNKSMEGLLISNTSGVNVSNVANDTLNITDSLAFGNVNNTVLNSNDNITIVSRASKTARVADITNGGSSSGNSITGKVIVERFIPARRSWRMLTVPIKATGAPTFNTAWQEGVVNPDYVYANHLDPNPGYGMLISGASTALGFDPSPNNNPSIKLYNPSNDTWAGIPNTNSAKVTDSTGYMVFIRGNRSTQISLNTAAPLSTTVLRAKGQIKTGIQNFTIPANTGFYNIVGNPYASAIDFRKVTVSGSIGSGYVVWDPNLTGVYSVGAYQYFYWDGTDNRVFPGSGSYGAANSISNIIQSSQAFLVQRAGSGTVTIGENAKAVSSTSNVFRPSNAPNQGQLSTLFSIENTDGSTSLADGSLSLFDNSFSSNIDLNDFRKVNNIAENFAIIKDNVALSIERRQPISSDDTIFYKMSQLRLRNYQLAISVQNFEPGTTAFLEDKHLQSRTALDMNGTTIHHFTVTNDSGAYNPGRFKVVFKSFVALPVTFTSINAYKQSSHINVDWKVENELNIQQYELEKSTDRIHFTKIETLGNVSNNNTAHSYKLADANPVVGFNYYRIKSIETDGRAQWSGIVKVLFTSGKYSITIFPNPVVDGIIHLQLNGMPSGKYNLRLMNSLGQIVGYKQIQHTEGANTESFAFDDKIPQGAYQLEIMAPDGSKTKLGVVY